MTKEEAIEDIQKNILPVVGGKSLVLAIEALQLSIGIDAVAGCLGTRDFSVPETPPILHSHCIRCGKALKNPKAQERGYGEVCWQKHLSDNQRTLF